MPETKGQGGPGPQRDYPDPLEPRAASRLSGLAAAGLAAMGAWAALQVAMDLWEVPAVPVLWFAAIGLSFAFPTAGAAMAALALSRIAHPGDQLGGRFLAIAALLLGAAVGAVQIVRGRPVTMLGCALAAVAAVAVYGEAERVAGADGAPRARGD